MRKVLETCPSCEQRSLVVSEMTCTRCATTVRSQYETTIFARLDRENLRFIEIFVRNKGNVKEMERELGVSYWAIRNRLNEVIELLWPASVEQVEVDRDAVLQQLERGEISVAEAAEKLAK